MKLISSIAVITLLVTFAACATVPTGPAPSVKDVAGTWTGTFSNARGQSGPATLTAGEDGKWSLSVPSLNIKASGTVSAEQGVLRWRSEDTNRTGTWTLRGNTLVVDSDDGNTKSVYTRG